MEPAAAMLAQELAAKRAAILRAQEVQLRAHTQARRALGEEALRLLRAGGAAPPPAGGPAGAASAADADTDRDAGWQALPLLRGSKDTHTRTHTHTHAHAHARAHTHAQQPEPEPAWVSRRPAADSVSTHRPALQRPATAAPPGWRTNGSNGSFTPTPTHTHTLAHSTRAHATEVDHAGGRPQSRGGRIDGGEIDSGVVAAASPKPRVREDTHGENMSHTNAEASLGATGMRDSFRPSSALGARSDASHADGEAPSRVGARDGSRRSSPSRASVEVETSRVGAMDSARASSAAVTSMRAAHAPAASTQSWAPAYVQTPNLAQMLGLSPSRPSASERASARPASAGASSPARWPGTPPLHAGTSPSRPDANVSLASTVPGPDAGAAGSPPRTPTRRSVMRDDETPPPFRASYEAEARAQMRGGSPLRAGGHDDTTGPLPPPRVRWAADNDRRSPLPSERRSFDAASDLRVLHDPHAAGHAYAASPKEVRAGHPPTFVVSPPRVEHSLEAEAYAQHLSQAEREHRYTALRAKKLAEHAAKSAARADAASAAAEKRLAGVDNTAMNESESDRSKLAAAVFGMATNFDDLPAALQLPLPRTQSPQRGFGGRVPLRASRATRSVADIGEPTALLMPAAESKQSPTSIDDDFTAPSPHAPDLRGPGSRATSASRQGSVRFDVDVAPPRRAARPSLGAAPPRERSSDAGARARATPSVASASAASRVEEDAARAPVAPSSLPRKPSARSFVGHAGATGRDDDASVAASSVAASSAAASRAGATRAPSAPRRPPVGPSSTLAAATQRSGGTTTAANKKRIVNALQTVCLAGAHRAGELEAALDAIASVPNDTFLVLVASPESTAYKALYTLDHASGECKRIHGAGPAELTELVHNSSAAAVPAGGTKPAADAPQLVACFKYSTSQRCFQQLPSLAIGLTTDAISIKPPRRRM